MTQGARDPRTYQPHPDREGLPGHQGLSRDEVIFLRVMHHLKQRIEFVALQQDRSVNDLINDALTEKFLGPLSGVNIVEPPAPELTPEVAFANLDGPAKEAIPEPSPQKGKPMAPKPKPVETRGDDIWTPLAPRLKERVSSQHFETWLSSVRFLLSEGPLLVLLCPNTFFQEYLGEHYTEVIQEELLAKYKQPYQVEFTVLPEETQRAEAMESAAISVPPLMQLIIDEKVSTIDELEALEDSLLPGVYQRRLDEAKRRSGSNEARMAEEVAILKGQRLKEEAARVEFRRKRRVLLAATHAAQSLKLSGNPKYHRQYAPHSHFNPEAPVTRKDLKDFS